MTDSIIDLRSDTVTRPTPAMREAMAGAKVGDDVLGDDPTVIALQDRIAALMGKEAACYVPSGSMANQCAIRAQTEPGDEVLAHRDSHIIHYETGGPAALSGVMINPLDGPLGQFGVEDVATAIHPDNVHSPRSRLLVIENTQNRGGGSVWPLEVVARVTAHAHERGLKTHLDGARIWNACVATGHAPADYARHFDTVSCCFSKGLGAPVGSAVCGDKATIARVFRFRKMFGGAMRQSGVLAAAAMYALEHHRDRMSEDHAHAQLLASAVKSSRGLSLAMPVSTNMVFFTIDSRLGTAADVCARLRERGVWMLPTGAQRARAVCHLDVNRHAIERALTVLGEVCN
jgi:threonine aldolase